MKKKIVAYNKNGQRKEKEFYCIPVRYIIAVLLGFVLGIAELAE